MDKPFYWTSHCDCQGDGICHAAHGWYQWTHRGLVYLGDSILEPMPKYLTAGNEALGKLSKELAADPRP